MPVFTTAFQKTSFQNDAFQIANAVPTPPTGGGSAMAINGTLPPLYSTAAAVTPSDTVGNAFLGFLVTVAGNVVIRAHDSAIDATIPCAAGVIYPIWTTFIRNTNTTATGIIGFN